MHPEPNSQCDHDSIRALEQHVRAFCEAREWDRFHSAKELAIGISTEAGELLQIFRFLSEEQERTLMTDADGRMSVEHELADVMIFVFRMSQRFGIDIGEAVQRKLQLNAARYPIESSRGNNRKADR